MSVTDTTTTTCNGGACDSTFIVAEGRCPSCYITGIVAQEVPLPTATRCGAPGGCQNTPHRYGVCDQHSVQPLKTLRTFRSEPWSHQAACRGADPNIFFPERGDHVAVRRAVQVCRTCPVVADCLNYVLRIGEKDGVFAGLTGAQRRRLRRRRPSPT